MRSRPSLSLRFWANALFRVEHLEQLPVEPPRPRAHRTVLAMLFAPEPLALEPPEPGPPRLKVFRYLFLPESLRR